MYGRVTFENPQVGDEVAYYNGREQNPTKRAITKVTATQVVITGDLRFMRSTGHIVGRGSYNYEHIEPWTEEVEKAIAKRAAQALLRERRKQVLERLGRVTEPVRLMPNPQHRPDHHDNRVPQLVDRPLSNRQLDMVEALIAELERAVAGTVEALNAPRLVPVAA